MILLHGYSGLYAEGAAAGEGAELVAMSTMHVNGHSFAVDYDTIEVTSLRRPDETWRHVDAQGHEHRWYVGGQPVTRYDPNAKHTTPTLVWVKDGETWYEDDDEPHEIGHTECVICGEHVAPGHTSDMNRQFIRGLGYFTIDDEPVTEDEFRKRLAAAGFPVQGASSPTEAMHDGQTKKITERGR